MSDTFGGITLREDDDGVERPTSFRDALLAVADFMDLADRAFHILAHIKTGECIEADGAAQDDLRRVAFRIDKETDDRIMEMMKP